MSDRALTTQHLLRRLPAAAAMGLATVAGGVVHTAGGSFAAAPSGAALG